MSYYPYYYPYYSYSSTYNIVYSVLQLYRQKVLLEDLDWLLILLLPVQPLKQL